MLAPDPAVPQRDALLDERYMASRLGAARCERINAKYRVGDSLRVVYRADADRILAGRTFRGQSRSVFRRAAAASEPGAVLHLEELETVFWTFPTDRRLAGLRVFDRRNGALEALVGAPVARTRLMAYAPERAATAECRDADDRVLAYVKVHWDAAERELANAEAAAAAVGTADPHLRLPRVLAALAARPGARLRAAGRRPARRHRTTSRRRCARSAPRSPPCTTSARCRSGASTVSTRSGSRSPPRWSGARGRTARVPREALHARLAGGAAGVARPSTSTATPTSATRSSTAAASASSTSRMPPPARPPPTSGS